MNPSIPHVTVCVPTYNAGRTLRRTLDSILAQDYPDFEVLVCDNLSTDDTAQIAQEYAAKAVRYFLNPVRAEWGESNWNHALSLAAGPLIALYHADDLYTPTMVRRQAEFLQAQPEVSSVFTMTQVIDGDDRPIRMGSTHLPADLKGKEIFEFSELFNAVLKHSNFMTVPTLMTRRETLNAVGMFDTRFATAADLDLWLRMARWRPIGIIDEPLHRYRISDWQGSAQINRLRTHLAHLFNVIDHYLTMPDVRAHVQPDALAIYEMERSADQVLCAMNLLTQGQVDEARERLKDALHWQHLWVARRRSRRLTRLLIGVGLLMSTWLRVGTVAGRGLYQAYQWDLQRRKKPLRRS